MPNANEMFVPHSMVLNLWHYTLYSAQNCFQCAGDLPGTQALEARSHRRAADNVQSESGTGAEAAPCLQMTSSDKQPPWRAASSRPRSAPRLPRSSVDSRRSTDVRRNKSSASPRRRPRITTHKCKQAWRTASGHPTFAALVSGCMNQRRSCRFHFLPFQFQKSGNCESRRARDFL